MLKKINVFLLAVLFVGSVLAQPDKGSIYLGGTIGTHYNSSKGVSNFVLQAVPQGGYFLSRDFVAILGVGYSMNTTKFKSPDYTTKAPMLHIIPMVKYYWRPVEKAGAFLTAYADIASGKYEASSSFGSSKGKNSNFDLALKCGLFVYVYKNVAVEVSLSDFGSFKTTSKPDGMASSTSTVTGVLIRPNTFSISFFM